MLVVDDERAHRELLRRWLEAWGYPVTVAPDARAALEAMLASPADILMADIKMPQQDGMWLAERVREKWPRTQIIMATGVMDVATVKKAQQLGAVDYVTKPFGRELLRQALDRAEQKLAHDERGNS